MCFICENIGRDIENQYNYSIISYKNGERIFHEYAIRYLEDSDEYILYVRSDKDADMQLIPITYCPFCGNRLH